MVDFTVFVSTKFFKISKWSGWHLVSGTACKVHHTALTISKNMNKLKNQQVFLEPWEKWYHIAKLCPKNWRDREVHTEKHNLPDQKLRRNQCQDRKTQSVIDKLLEAQYEQVWKLKIPGHPDTGRPTCFCEFYLQELSQILRVNLIEKNPLELSEELGKETFWSTPEHSVLNKNYPQDKVFYQGLTCCWDFIRA